jgi:hypothetical protein
VYALFRAKVNVVNHAKKDAIAKELLVKLAPEKVRSESALRNAVADLVNDSGEECEHRSIRAELAIMHKS